MLFSDFVVSVKRSLIWICLVSWWVVLFLVSIMGVVLFSVMLNSWWFWFYSDCFVRFVFVSVVRMSWLLLKMRMWLVRLVLGMFVIVLGREVLLLLNIELVFESRLVVMNLLVVVCLI